MMEQMIPPHTIVAGNPARIIRKIVIPTSQPSITPTSDHHAP